jgi:hypothetical protein
VRSIKKQEAQRLLHPNTRWQCASEPCLTHAPRSTSPSGRCAPTAASCSPAPDPAAPPPRGPQEERARVSQGNFHYIERYDILPGDVNRDRCVDDSDLLRVLFAFGQTGSGLPEDLNGDNTVDDADLLTVLFNFGSGCE